MDVIEHIYDLGFEVWLEIMDCVLIVLIVNWTE